MSTMPLAKADTIAQVFLTEFDLQTPFTRRFLERVPEEKLAWKPHERSLSAGQLALHLASWPGYVVHFVAESHVQARSESVFPQPSSKAEILDALDACTASVHQTLPAYNDRVMTELWHLMAGETEVLAVPRFVFLRDVMFSHMYQHRGQLSVYLRLLNVPVPAVWGPSADETPSFMQSAPTPLEGMPSLA